MSEICGFYVELTDKHRKEEKMKKTYLEPSANMIELTVSDVITVSLILADNVNGFDDGDTLERLFG